MFRPALAPGDGPRERESDDDQEGADREKAEIPAERGTQVVADVVDAEQRPSTRPSTRLNTPQPASSMPRCARYGGASSPRCHARTVISIAPTTRNPGRQVEEPVGQCVRLEPGDGVGRVVAGVGEHVVPLQDLVENDPVDEPA